MNNYIGEGKFVCETCKGRWKTRDELVDHGKTPLHLIEMARKEIDQILTTLELRLR
jgi:hypothetical protein